VTDPDDASILDERVRTLLTPEGEVREVRMFGGLSFMLNDAMVVATHHADGMLVRVDPERAPELLRRPGAGPFEMGAGRTMGPGWIHVAGEVLGSDEELAFWIGEALAENRRRTG